MSGSWCLMAAVWTNSTWNLNSRNHRLSSLPETTVDVSNHLKAQLIVHMIRGLGASYGYNSNTANATATLTSCVAASFCSARVCTIEQFSIVHGLPLSRCCSSTHFIWKLHSSGKTVYWSFARRSGGISGFLSSVLSFSTAPFSSWVMERNDSDGSLCNSSLRGASTSERFGTTQWNAL